MMLHSGYNTVEGGEMKTLWHDGGDGSDYDDANDGDDGEERDDGDEGDDGNDGDDGDNDDKWFSGQVMVDFSLTE